jgi:hypothetical protein
VNVVGPALALAPAKLAAAVAECAPRCCVLYFHCATPDALVVVVIVTVPLGRLTVKVTVALASGLPALMIVAWIVTVVLTAALDGDTVSDVMEIGSGGAVTVQLALPVAE